MLKSFPNIFEWGNVAFVAVVVFAIFVVDAATAAVGFFGVTVAADLYSCALNTSSPFCKIASNTTSFSKWAFTHELYLYNLLGVLIWVQQLGVLYLSLLAPNLVLIAFKQPVQ